MTCWRSRSASQEPRWLLERIAILSKLSDPCVAGRVPGRVACTKVEVVVMVDAKSWIKMRAGLREVRCLRLCLLSPPAKTLPLCPSQRGLEQNESVDALTVYWRSQVLTACVKLGVRVNRRTQDARPSSGADRRAIAQE